MPETVSVKVNGVPVAVSPGATVAAAIVTLGEAVFRRSVRGEPRGPLCGMGICFECRVTVNGVAHVRSCEILCGPGMEIETDRC